MTWLSDHQVRVARAWRAKGVGNGDIADRLGVAVADIERSVGADVRAQPIRPEACGCGWRVKRCRALDEMDGGEA